MATIEFTAFPRTTEGRGASRRMRRAGKAPGIVYGGDDRAAADRARSQRAFPRAAQRGIPLVDPDDEAFGRGEQGTAARRPDASVQERDPARRLSARRREPEDPHEGAAALRPRRRLAGGEARRGDREPRDGRARRHLPAEGPAGVHRGRSHDARPRQARPRIGAGASRGGRGRDARQARPGRCGSRGAEGARRGGCRGGAGGGSRGRSTGGGSQARREPRPPRRRNRERKRRRNRRTPPLRARGLAESHAAGLFAERSESDPCPSVSSSAWGTPAGNTRSRDTTRASGSPTRLRRGFRPRSRARGASTGWWRARPATCDSSSRART